MRIHPATPATPSRSWATRVGKPAGYTVVPDSAYHDVQCESCHGPGLTHAENPDITTNQPLASIHVDTALANGCGGCHTGTHEPFVDQWVQSAHGSGPGFASAGRERVLRALPRREGRDRDTVWGHRGQLRSRRATRPISASCAPCATTRTGRRTSTSCGHRFPRRRPTISASSAMLVARPRPGAPRARPPRRADRTARRASW